MKMRYERKIILNHAQYSELNIFLSFIMKRDKHNLPGKNYYPVNSLYYDNSNFDFLFEKVEGDFEHNKVRLRCYNDSHFTDSAFIEHKYKKDNIQIKPKDYLDTKFDINNPTMNVYFRNLFEKYSLQPIVGVSYFREAFDDNLDGHSLRINFDYNLSYFPVRSIGTQDYRKVKEDIIILEVKTDKATLPEILTQKLNSMNLKWSAFSKYASALKHLY